MSSRALLTTKELEAGYPRRLLFSSLNLTIPSYRLICFMGPNGSGKSTLLRTLAGIQKPLKGQIDYFNDPADEPLSRKISVVLTDRIYAGHMTASDLITIGRYPHLQWNLRLTSKDNDAITNAVRETQTGDILSRKLSELSDGQMQMVLIARALAQDGDLLLLDEPTAHLDLNNRLDIMNLLRRLAHESGKGVLTTTHDLHLALQTADEIWLAGENQSIIRGIPEDLVLNGAFDQIFQFKGFDLRSGRVAHEVDHHKKIRLSGEGPVFLWTRNALERSGWNVCNEGLEVTIHQNTNEIVWNTPDARHTSIESLLHALEK